MSRRAFLKQSSKVGAAVLASIAFPNNNKTKHTH
ncbi:MAG: twin-arginine translocation signal domain-containing protein, partial [Candidatus Electrothrix sp. AR3]|nr:twin-arginine translocation signal domain-containing protein [Candidatus Electrothrix sp. AR3]